MALHNMCLTLSASGCNVDGMQGAGVWSSVSVRVMAPVGWTRADIDAGLRELERIRRMVDAASAALITGLGTRGRDTAAAFARATGSSGRRAREQAKTAEVVEKVAGAAAALESGEVSAEHLCVLARLTDADEAAELLPLAATQTPEDFAATVTRFSLSVTVPGYANVSKRPVRCGFSRPTTGVWECGVCSRRWKGPNLRQG